MTEKQSFQRSKSQHISHKFQTLGALERFLLLSTTRLVKAQAPKSWLRGAHALAACRQRIYKEFPLKSFFHVFLLFVNQSALLLEIKARRLYNCTTVRSCSFSWSFLAILFGAPTGPKLRHGKNILDVYVPSNVQH